MLRPLSELRAGRGGAKGGLSGGGSPLDLRAGGSGGPGRQVSGFQSEAQQQLGGDESHNDLLGFYLLRLQAALETFVGR